MNWEITTFIAYFVILLGVALVFYFNGTNKNSEDFFLGGRSMGPWVTALSAQASDMSAWLLMGLPGSILAFGFGQMWIGIGLVGEPAGALLLVEDGASGDGHQREHAVVIDPRTGLVGLLEATDFVG